MASRIDRLWPVDALRGLIIILMALDHANLFVAQKHSAGEYWGGPFPLYNDQIAFLTRLVTHLAAPGFFFLMGVGMHLFTQARQEKGWNKTQILSHFWLRGAILIALQFLVVNRAWSLSPGGWQLDTYVGVLFALGGSMILASLVLWMRSPVLVFLAVFFLIGTELVHPVPGEWSSADFDPLTLLLLHPGGDLALWSNYPVLPWLELVLFGLLFGRWLTFDAKKTFNGAIIIGLACLVIFVLFRSFDGFGNIRPRIGEGWIGFLNVVKYPPSLVFTLMTMGANMLILGMMSRIRPVGRRLLWPLAVYGRVPLFFYVVHLFLYAYLGLTLKPEGTSIPGMYPYWLLGLLLLLPMCLVYATLKRLPSLRSALGYF